jgi:hypothetical protein
MSDEELLQTLRALAEQLARAAAIITGIARDLTATAEKLARKDGA